MRKALTLLITLLCANLALAQNKPLACQVDAAVGLRWENSAWKIARFTERKFILVMKDDTLTKESVAEVFLLPKQLGTDFVTCISAWDKLTTCLVNSTRALVFDPRTNRGGTSHLAGTALGNDVDRDTPFMEAFTCQPY